MSGSITTSAQAGLDQLFSDSLAESLRVTDNIVDVNLLKEQNNIDEEEFIMLTLSSYSFKIFTLLHFSNNKESRQYVAQALKIAYENLEENKFYDYLSEVGNTFCGAFKRELGKYFPHTGMSTPNRLEKGCLSHMKDIGFEYETHYELKFKGLTSFYGSMYVVAYSELDFHVPINSRLDDNIETGALEMF